MNERTILVVDDDPRIADTLKYILTEVGFQVIWASTGKQALELAQTKQVDFMLLDIHLPDMRGFDVCRQLRKQGRRLPIMMMSVENQETDIVRGLKAGANDYITKPFGLDELTSRIEAHLHWRAVYSQSDSPPDTSTTETPTTTPIPKKEPSTTKKRLSSEEMPLLTRIAIRNGNKKRKNTATRRIEALDRARVENWNRKLAAQLDQREEQKKDQTSN